jgi:cytochrome P450
MLCSISLLRTKNTIQLRSLGKISQGSHGKRHTWTKFSISQMIKTDRICRETLRIKTFANRSVFKKVMIDGLRTEDGILLPKGALPSVIVCGLYSDSKLFDEPVKFDPFRFSHIREDSTLDANEKSNLTSGSTGPKFLPFGESTACPGRFFFIFEFKMIVAYLVMNYDIELPKEHEGKRPESKWMAESICPSSEGRQI